jgi:hypothetical protein
MEPYPLHYSRRARFDDGVDPTVRFVMEEFQKMDARLGEMEVRLGNRIEGCYSGLERCVAELEQRVKERLITLEMACSESEQSRVSSMGRSWR